MWLGLALKGVGFLLDVFKANKETQKRFLALVDAAKDDGLITVQAHDKFKSQKEILIERMSDGKTDKSPQK